MKRKNFINTVMKKCIYCLREFEKADPEHVFPATFGCSKDYILNCVCQECNQKLGKELINFISYDSIDALHKYQLKRVLREERRRRERLTQKIAQSQKEKYFKGALERITKNLKFELEPHIQVRDRVILSNDIKENIEFLQTLTKEDKVLVLARDEQEEERMMHILGEIGIKLNHLENGKLSEPPLTEVEMIVDTTVKRFYNYLAFNYLCYKQTPEYLYKERFDGIRQYILNGTPMKIDNFNVARVKNNRNFTLPDRPYHLFFFEINKKRKLDIVVALFGINKPVYQLDFGYMPIAIKGKIDIYDIENNMFIEKSY